MSEQDALNTVRGHVSKAMQALIEKCPTSRVVCIAWEELEDVYDMLEYEVARLARISSEEWI